MMRLEKSAEMGMNAPATQSICKMPALTSHFSVMRMTMNSLATNDRPSIRGKVMKAVKRSNLRSTDFWRSRSSSTLVNTGWAMP